MTLRELRDAIDKALAEGVDENLRVALTTYYDDLDYSGVLSSCGVGVMDDEGNCFELDPEIEGEEMFILQA